MKEIELKEALIRMIEKPNTVAVFEEIENPADAFTVGQLWARHEAGSLLFFDVAEEVKDENEEVKEEVEEVKAEVKEPKKKENRPTEIDDGKIRALYTAKWSMRQIAEEMHISQPTVFAHLKKMGLAGREQNAGEDC